MAEEGKTSLFREKSLEAIESPESLNDYLRVTSAGVWLVLASIIVLLAGAIIWGIFGRIETRANLAVDTHDGRTVCYVPYDILQEVTSQGIITIGGQDYALAPSGDVNVTTVSEGMSPFVRVAGNLTVGDLVVAIPVDTSLADGVYQGTVVTESLQPISLLMQ